MAEGQSSFSTRVTVTRDRLTTGRCEGLAEAVQLGKHTVLQPKLRDHPMTTRSIYPRRVRLIDDQVGIAHREYLIHSIDHRVYRRNGPIRTIHALHRNKHATLTLLECHTFFPERPHGARSTRTSLCTKGRQKRGVTRIIVDGSVDGCIVEERVARLRYVREEARVGVEARVEEEGCGRAERLC